MSKSFAFSILFLIRSKGNQGQRVRVSRRGAAQQGGRQGAARILPVGALRTILPGKTEMGGKSGVV